MEAKHQPKTRLPWKVSGIGYLCNDKTVIARTHIVPEHLDQSVTLFVSDADYIAHAANAYPKLVEALRDAMHKVAKPEDCRSIQDLLVGIGEIR